MSKWKILLTPELVMEEYIEWLASYGEGRSRDGLRFGQYMANQYLRNGESTPVIYNLENAHEAYVMILEECWPKEESNDCSW